MNLTNEAIRRHVDAGSYARGEAYARQRRVVFAEYDEKDNALLGEVRGSQKQPYDVWIDIAPDGRITHSECSCPLGGSCKHVAAVSLTVIAARAGAIISRPKPSSKPSPSRAEWETRLSRYVQTKLDEPVIEAVLLVQLADPPVWPGNRTKRQLIQLRPAIIEPATGKLSTTKLTWSNLYETYPSITIDRRVRLLLQQLGYVTARQDPYFYGNSRWASVGDRNAADVWTLLQELVALGAKLLAGSKGGGSVVLAEEVLRLDLALDDTASGVAVKPKLTQGGEAIDMLEVILAGDPPAMAALWPEAPPYSHEMKLYAVQSKLSQAMIQDLLVKPLVVPEAETKAFAQRFLPELAERFAVANTSARVTLPQSVPPKLHLELGGDGQGRLDLRPGLAFGDVVTPLYSEAPQHISPSGEVVRHERGRVSELRGQAETALVAYPQLWDKPPAEHKARMAQPPKLREAGSLEGTAAAYFYTQLLPELEGRADVTVVRNAGVPDFRLDETEPAIEFRVDESSEHDWFNLGIIVSIGGEKLEFATLFTALNDNRSHLLLPSGRYIPLGSPAFDKLRSLIAESQAIHDASPEGLTVSRYQAGLWAELEAMGVTEQQSRSWQTAMQGLLKANPLGEIAMPTGVAAQLRPYQLAGFNWLAMLASSRLGGILADDMGLGKTIQMICLLVWLKEHREPGEAAATSLVVAPTSVVDNWEAELAKFAPGLKVVAMHSGDRSARHEAAQAADVVVTSYALLRRDFEQMQARQWATVVLDEAQFVKNHQSLAYQQIRQLKAPVKFALTGTPLENNLMELWSIASVVAPGLFPKPKQFNELFAVPIEKNGDQAALERLRNRLRPFLMRRTKEVVVGELPPKVEQIMMVELGPKQRKLYELHLQRERKKVLGLLDEGGLQKNRFMILKSITLLRQLCLHPGMADKKHAKLPSSKLEQLRPQLETLISENHRVLIFSQFTSFLKHAKELCETLGAPYLYLDGSTKQRGELVKEFQSGSAAVFLISLKAGGVGLNLTRADYCIMLDPWWNPAAENQAIDRAHRIGQKESVTVYKMIAKDTIEEKVLALQTKKRELFKNVLDEGELFSTAATEDDIRQIFG